MKRLAFCIVLVGCGGDDSGSGGYVEVDNLGLELGLASCAKQFDCCTDAEIMEQYMGITLDDMPITTEEQCVEFTNAIFSGLFVAELEESIAAGRAEYDGAAAGDCIAALRSLTCAQYSSAMSDESALSCGAFILPKVAEGGACGEDFECTTGNCDGESEDVDGTCTTLPGEGETCSGDCAGDLSCNFDQSSGMQVCEAPKPAGAECSLDRECASDFCDDATDMCATEPPTCDGR